MSTINVMVKATGGRPEIAEIEEGGTVADALADVGTDPQGLSFKVSGNEAQLDTVLKDEQTIVVGERVKGGL